MKTKKIQIKDLKINDKIKSYKNNKIVFSPVSAIFNSIIKKEDRLILCFKNNTQLHCSSNHPIMILENNMVIEKYPKDISIHDIIITDSGYTQLINIEKDINALENYIDITVDDTHLFFAAKSKESEMILTHNSQGGVRRGSATAYFPIWHLEIQDLLVLKNNKGSDDNRVRQLDYAIQFNKLFYERVLSKDKFTLFSPSDVPGLYEAFFQDQELFKELYLKYEKDKSIRKIQVDANTLFESFLIERLNTGRIYLMNVDHSNTNSAFDSKDASIYMSNLCVAGNTIVNVKVNDTVKVMKIKSIGNIIKDNEVFILSYNKETNSQEFKKIKAFAKTSNKSKVLKLKYADKELICTPEHKVFTKNRGYVQAKDLLENDVLNVIQLNTSKFDCILKIEYLEKEIPVYDITVEDNENFYANNILIHNCLEITLPTKPLQKTDDENAEIALCTLAAVNLGKIRKLSDLEYQCELLVRCLDSILTYQNYPLKAAENSVLNYRPLGVGVINYAYYLAKNGFKANTIDALNLTHETFEALQYYCLKASVKLSKEFGKCEKFENTTYSKGILPIDRYKKEVDSVHSTTLKLDWESLRSDIKEFGLRNSTLTTQFPSETSSQVSSATSGGDLIKDFVSTKITKDTVSTFIVPNLKSLKSKYTIVWDLSNEEILNLYAIMQKFIDQSISSNTYHDPRKYNDNKIPMSVLKKEILHAYKMGIKTLYYANMYVENTVGSGAEDNSCESGACKL